MNTVGFAPTLVSGSSPLQRQCPLAARGAASRQAEAPAAESVALSSEARAAAGAGGPLPASSSPGWLRKSMTGLMVAMSLAGACGLGACSDASSAPQPPRTAVTQMAEKPAAPLLRRSTQEVEAASRNSVTAAELQPGQHRFTAAGVDPNQASKVYHKPDSAKKDTSYGTSVNDTPIFLQCLKTDAATGKCQQNRTNQISHVTLSCLYRDEADGQVYRVVHKSMQNFATKEMERMVCGGHRLERQNSDFPDYRPVQVDAQGNGLYLNPNNVIAILPANTNLQ